MVAVDAFHVRPIDASRDPWQDEFMAMMAFGSIVSAITGDEGRDWAQLPRGLMTPNQLEEHIGRMRRMAGAEGKVFGMPVEILEAMIRRGRSLGPDGLLYGKPTREQGLRYMNYRREQIEKGELPTIAIYEQLDCPALLLGATRGPYARDRPTIDELPIAHPNLTLQWLDCGHMIPLEMPEILATRILDFVSAHAREA
jgi:pimeloyl-ACP methyl ester carboxylesterase